MQPDEPSVDQVRRQSSLTPPSGEAVVVSIVGRAARAPTDVICSCSLDGTSHGCRRNPDDTARRRGRSV